jgi:hypothetical protein
LRVLDLDASSHAPVIRAESLLKSENVRDMSLYGFEVTNPELVLSCDRVQVIKMKLENPKCLDALNQRKDFMSLKSLDLSTSEFGDADLSPYFENTKGLKALEMRYADMSWLTKTDLCKHVCTLILPECSIPDEVLLYLTQATQLRVLSLEHSQNVTIKGIEAIANHPSLTQLELAGALGNNVDQALQYLLKSTVLQQLDVSSNHSTDPEALSLVGQNNTLTMLDVRDFEHISDSSLQAIFKTNQSLTSLYLGGGKLSLDYEKCFKDMNTNLTDLYFESVHIPDMHIVLAKCKHLQMIWMQPPEENREEE